MISKISKVEEQNSKTQILGKAFSLRIFSCYVIFSTSISHSLLGNKSLVLVSSCILYIIVVVQVHKRENLVLTQLLFTTCAHTHTHHSFKSFIIYLLPNTLLYNFFVVFYNPMPICILLSVLYTINGARYILLYTI